MISLTKFPFFLFILSFINITTLTAQGKLVPGDKDLEHLNRFNSDYVKCVLEQKPEMIRDYYSEDIRLMPEYQKTVMGKDNAMAYHKAFADRFDVLQYDRTKNETLDLGSRVLEFGTFDMSIKLRENGEKYEIKGNYGDIWQKYDDGSLKLITEAWNYNERVNCAEYLIFDQVPVVNIAFASRVPINSDISFQLAAINKFTEEFITQHDDHLWSMLYAEDGRLIYSNHPIYDGKKEIDDFLADHVKGLPIFEKLDIRTDRIDDLGGFVIEYSSHIAVVKSGDWSGVNTGKNLVVWRRAPDYSLKIFRSIAMYD